MLHWWYFSTCVSVFPIWYLVFSPFIVNVNKVSVYFQMDCAKLQKVNTSKSQLQMSTLAYLSITAVFSMLVSSWSTYRKRAIITRGLYTFFLKSKKVFSRGFFLKILALCMVSIQERVMMARVWYSKLNVYQNYCVN